MESNNFSYTCTGGVGVSWEDNSDEEAGYSNELDGTVSNDEQEEMTYSNTTEDDMVPFMHYGSNEERYD